MSIDLTRLLAEEKFIQKPSKQNMKNVLQKYLDCYPDSRIHFLSGSDDRSKNYINFLFHNPTNKKDDRPAIRGQNWAEYFFHMLLKIDACCDMIAHQYDLSKHNTKTDPNEVLSSDIKKLEEALLIMEKYTGLSKKAMYISADGYQYDVDNMLRTWKEAARELKSISKLGNKKKDQKAQIRAEGPLILSRSIFKIFEYKPDEEIKNCTESIVKLFEKYNIKYDARPLKTFIKKSVKSFYSDFLHTTSA